MTRTAYLSCTVYVQYQDNRGRDCGAEVEVDYTFDGDIQSEPHITTQRDVYGAEGISDWELDELVWEAVNERCMDDYAEWPPDRADWSAAA